MGLPCHVIGEIDARVCATCNLAAAICPPFSSLLRIKLGIVGRQRRVVIAECPSEVVQYKVLIYLRRPIRWDVAFANLLLDP